MSTYSLLRIQSHTMSELQFINYHSYAHVDVVIANRGISDWYGSAAENPQETLRDHLEVNNLGSLALFRLFYLCFYVCCHEYGCCKSGRYGGDDTDARSIYGASEAAMNFLVRKINSKHERVCSWVLSPVWVRTEMDNHGVEIVGIQRAPVSSDQSIEAILEKIDKATREE
ncbi:hypothetical protein E4T39_00402 [Aureobasidium subglaciale]|nr:hypothetical protein E4T39_00402 [Aureobasidium subglaciale]